MAKLCYCNFASLKGWIITRHPDEGISSWAILLFEFPGQIEFRTYKSPGPFLCRRRIIEIPVCFLLRDWNRKSRKTVEQKREKRRKSRKNWQFQFTSRVNLSQIGSNFKDIKIIHLAFEDKKHEREIDISNNLRIHVLMKPICVPFPISSVKEGQIVSINPLKSPFFPNARELKLPLPKSGQNELNWRIPSGIRLQTGFIHLQAVLCPKLILIGWPKLLQRFVYKAQRKLNIWLG